MPTIIGRRIAAFVFSGETQDLHIPVWNPDPGRPPEERAMWPLYEPVERTVLDRFYLFDATCEIAARLPIPDEHECKTALATCVRQFFGSAWQVGDVIVRGRAVIDHTWVPIHLAPTPLDFGYGFRLQQLDESTGSWTDYLLRMGVSGTYLTGHAIVVVQDAQQS